MKLNPKMIELLVELSAIEAAENQSLLIGDGLFLRKNLLTLYRRTDKPQSHILIIQIMAEGGYPWFSKLVEGANELTPLDTASLNVEPLEIQPENGSSIELFMSEDEFLELLPANGHFH